MTGTIAPAAESAFDAGLAAHRRGDLPLAEAMYRQALRIDPAHPDALHLFGVLRHQQGHHADAIASIRQAITFKGPSASYLLNLAAVHRAANELAATADCYRQLLAISPERADAMLLLAQVLRSAGERDEAIELCRRIIARGDCFEARELLGNLCHELGRHAAAIVEYRAALSLRPESAAVINNLATALERSGEIDEAILLWEQAARLQPGRTEILCNLGSARRAAGDSVGAFADLSAALDAAPQNPLVHHNFANWFKEAGDWEQARRHYLHAIELNPQLAEAYAGLSLLDEQAGDTQQAAMHLHRAIGLQPRSRWRIKAATLLPPIYESRADLEYRREALAQSVDALIADGVQLDPAREQAILSFYLAYRGGDERPIQTRLASLAHPSHLFRRKPPGKKIRVGVISRHLREHTIGRLFKNTVAGLADEQFDVTLISVGRHQDSIVDLLRARVDRELVLDESIARSVQAVDSLACDVLIYTDLGMEPISWTLAHSRLAPVQCVTWGHPLTTGLPAIDYFLSSRWFETETADADYSERLVRFDSLGICYDRPTIDRSPAREALGLPRDRRLYGCLQSAFKLHPEFDAILGEILRRDPRGELILLEGQRPEWQSQLRRRWSHTMPDVADRIRFRPRVSWTDYLALTRACDVLLDPLHFSGGNTSLEAFALDMPIVTLPSPYLRGRITAGLLRRMGINTGIAADAESYVGLAIRIANDADFHNDLQLRIRERSPMLFGDSRPLRELKTFLIEAVETSRTKSGEDPR